MSRGRSITIIELTALITAIGGLIGSVAALYAAIFRTPAIVEKRVEKESNIIVEQLQSRLDELKDDNSQLKTEIEKIKDEIAEIKSLSSSPSPDKQENPPASPTSSQKYDNTDISLKGKPSFTYSKYNLKFTLNECIKENSTFACEVFVKNQGSDDRNVRVYSRDSDIYDTLANEVKASNAYFRRDTGNTDRVLLVPEGEVPLIIIFKAPHYQEKKIARLKIAHSYGSIFFRDVEYINR